MIGAVVQGSGFDGFVPVEPSRVTALFGPNGAGKSLILESLAAALGALSGSPIDLPRRAAPAASLLLDCGSQDTAPRIFGPLFVHLGWSPYTPLGLLVHRRVSSQIPVWGELTAPPSDTDAVQPLDASNRPVLDLRATIREAAVLTSEWAPLPSAAALLDAVLNSPIIAVSPDGRIGLAVFPGDHRRELIAAAAEFFAWLNQYGNTALVDLTKSIWQLADRILNLDDTPLVGPMAPIAHLQPLTVAKESGWVAAGEALLDSVRRHTPRPVRFDPWPGPGVRADSLVEAHVTQLLSNFNDPDDDFDEFDRPHPFASPLAEPVLHELANRATALLPAFIKDVSSIRIELEDPTTWHNRRCTVSLERKDLDERVALDAAPAGLRTWGYAAISFAAAQLSVGGWSATSSFFGPFTWHPGERNVLIRNISMRVDAAFDSVDPTSLKSSPQARAPLTYLLDEPEAHLHLTAQRDVVEVTGHLAAAGAGAVAATHSMAFLDDRTASTQVITVSRSDDETVLSEPSGMRDFIGRADQLGVPPSAFAQACLGVLAVEGINDQAMLAQYGGIDLDEHFVHVSVMQGRDGAPNLGELEFLHAMRIKIVVLLDHVRRSTLEAAITTGDKSLSGEERLLTVLHDALVRGRLTVAVLPFAQIDIACAVPDAEIDWALRRLGYAPFQGWARTIAAAEADRERDRTPFKSSFQAHTGAAVDDVLRVLRESGRRAESLQLKGMLAALLAYLVDGETTPGLVVLNPYSPRGSGRSA